MRFKIILIPLIVTLMCFTEINGDKACVAMQIKNKSVVCVCNATYCDTITRIPPSKNTYVTYTSSKSGLRFKKEINYLQFASKIDHETLVLDPTIKYQTIQGFGGAVTDSAGINWKNLSKPLQELLINSYFSNEGLEYNMIRVPIGGTDFSTHAYAFNETPENDTELSNFSLTYEDHHYKIPMIKAAMKASKTQVNVVATTWSPPLWMKSADVYMGRNFLKPEYYHTYAKYHLLFLESYLAEGIKVGAITSTNEPTNGLIGIMGVNSLGWTASDLGKWVVNNLGPTIRNSTVSDVKILLGDDQRLTIPYWINLVVIEHPEVLNYIDGIALHYYTDFIASPVLLTELSKYYPGKYIISTEACTGAGSLDLPHVDLGSWERAKRYIQDIITDLNYNVTGWIDWNMCLNEEGGPTWTGNNVDSPIIVFPEKGEFVKQPMFYALGQFSKFIPEGSIVIKATTRSYFYDSVDHIALVTPHNTIVVVLYNNGAAKTVNIQIGTKQAVVNMVPHSVTTVELSYKETMLYN